jgi:hypothetical protein
LYNKKYVLEVIHYQQQKKCHWGSNNVKMIKFGPYCNTQKGKEKQTYFAIIERFAAATKNDRCFILGLYLVV